MLEEVSSKKQSSELRKLASEIRQASLPAYALTVAAADRRSGATRALLFVCSREERGLGKKETRASLGIGKRPENASTCALSSR